ncbi:hypothetical protein BGW36DRAFT_434192 [Talaromyces proteolyticus]|uniref:Uncharacterized protein n=1 Tax=Talaromyces proteolyticus TaxID=1131652 RepID=A0AAD4PSD7_9EURO|nr:uncharacterized protein BGW36DRAFT_434192 [Talaromyces proteolyticus]KAH8688651.1 hypothetical protein BGW36DRAFT_434192 [Talaromyces proteolyticus]
MVPQGSEGDVNGSERPLPLDWPGERNPSRWDVHDANEPSGATFLQRFKAALLLSDDARGCQRLVTRFVLEEPVIQGRPLEEESMATGPARRYTYPMFMLSGLPLLPQADQLAALQTSFFTSFKTHIFLDSILVPGGSQEVGPPYLALAIACLASAVSQNSTSCSPVTHHLFVNGTSLWSAILKVDSREARLTEAVLSVRSRNPTHAVDIYNAKRTL